MEVRENEIKFKLDEQRLEDRVFVYNLESPKKVVDYPAKALDSLNENVEAYCQWIDELVGD